MTWPGGQWTQLRLDGAARDLFTPDDGSAATVLGRGSMSVGVSGDRVIEDIEVSPDHPEMKRLVRVRGGGRLRAALREIVPDEVAAGTPLALLLDDISGTSLIAGFAWSRWSDDWMSSRRSGLAVRRTMEGVCIGFRPGSGALTPDGTSRPGQNTVPVETLVHPDDPIGWHELAELPDVSMRRARRIDAWIDDGLIHIDSAFQDSAGDPGGRRVAVHEYRLIATADIERQVMTSVDADPRVLPYWECPDAASNVSTLLGVPLADLRAVVLERLTKTAGCTHLNDALRALAEVPILVRHLAD